MRSYYELTTAQTQADRRASAGYAVAPAATREFTNDAITRAINEQRQSVKIQAKAVRQTTIETLYSAIKVFFQRTGAVAR